MTKIRTGRLFSEEHPDLYGKWILGHFVKDPDFNTKNFEVKFQNDVKGMKRDPKPVIKPGTITLAVLVDGHVRLNFGDEDMFLKSRGDYIWWSPDTPHLFEYLEDSLVLTVRWEI